MKYFGIKGSSHRRVACARNSSTSRSNFCDSGREAVTIAQRLRAVRDYNQDPGDTFTPGFDDADLIDEMAGVNIMTSPRHGKLDVVEKIQNDRVASGAVATAVSHGETPVIE